MSSDQLRIGLALRQSTRNATSFDDVLNPNARRHDYGETLHSPRQADLAPCSQSSCRIHSVCCLPILPFW